MIRNAENLPLPHAADSQMETKNVTRTLKATQQEVVDSLSGIVALEDMEGSTFKMTDNQRKFYNKLVEDVNHLFDDFEADIETNNS